MAQVINTNILSLNSQRNLNSTTNSLATTVQRLSSGLRINSAKDDAAGLAISQRMTAQVRGMDVAARNANDGISLAQTAEGALGSIGDNLQRIRELTVQAANGTNDANDQDSIQKEIDQLTSEITRVVNNTKFNGTNLLNSSGTISIQVGADGTDNDKIDITLNDLSTALSGISGLSVSGLTAGSGASGVLGALDAALTTVNNARADLGAVQNRFTSAISNLQSNSENLSAARSRIQDTDYAKETAELTRTQILQQAGTAMLAQAKSLPQNVLSLLQ
ncbi:MULTISPECIES: flagellin N-terminal helical domain-containing protein [Gammaproteobacteria]|uniref:Flagellin n=1 Tax=Xanthomonas boreopolis TaxID=86183 RepID=A0A919F4J8_9XANT|nr:flagellin [Pseudomonas sp. Hp2]GHH46375.1 flagellin [[Pseudomonas] boreopolis]